MIPATVLREVRRGFGLPRGHVRLLSTRFGKLCLALRARGADQTQVRLVSAGAGTTDRLQSEMAYLTHLSTTHGLAVPRPRPWSDGALVSPVVDAGSGSGWHAIACSWVGGRHLNLGLGTHEMRRAGTLIAQVHLGGRDAAAPIAATRPVWWIPRLFALATSLRDLVSGDAPLPVGIAQETADGLRRAHAELVAAHAALPSGPAYEGLIHTDAHWQNLRFTTDRVGLVDFEDFANGRFMIDLACLYAKVESRTNHAALLDAALDGYSRVRTLPHAAMHDFRAMLAFRRFDYAGWVLSWPRPDLHTWGPELLRGAPAYIDRQLQR